MPKGIYKRTEEHKRNISKAKKGQNLGKIPWNKGLKGIKTSNKGQISWNKGKTNCFSEESRKKMSESHKGEIPWNKGKKGLQVGWKKGMKFLPEQNPMYGKYHSNKSKLMMSKKRRGLHMGNKNPNWKGGLSFEPYTKYFNNKFKRAIRKRDNQICMLCGIHREKLKKTLGVHHINYNKEVSISQNCLCLCNICHTKTNFNRKHWVKFFQCLLEEKYGYKYTKDNLPIINLEIIKNEI